MKAKSDRRKILTGQQGKSLKAALILVVFVCALLLGIIVDQALPRSWGEAPIASPYAVEEGGLATLDPANLQLKARVEDGITYLQITVSLIGVTAVLLGIALGLSIWQTGQHAVRLLDQHFLEFKVEELEPFLKTSRDQLGSLNNQVLLVNLGASTILLDDLLQTTQEMYQRHLESKGVTGDDLSELLKARRESFRESADVTRYLIATFSQDEGIVQDVCQKLYALAEERKDAIGSRAESILTHMRGLLGTWPQGSTRTWIQRVIDEIERYTGC